jgi:hypothetical protein
MIRGTNSFHARLHTSDPTASSEPVDRSEYPERAGPRRPRAMDHDYSTSGRPLIRGGALSFLPCPACPSSAVAATRCHRLGQPTTCWCRTCPAAGSVLSAVRHTDRRFRSCCPVNLDRFPARPRPCGQAGRYRLVMLSATMCAVAAGERSFVAVVERVAEAGGGAEQAHAAGSDGGVVRGSVRSRSFRPPHADSRVARNMAPATANPGADPARAGALGRRRSAEDAGASD